MKEMTSGTALRQLQQAQAALKKARQLLKQARGRGPAGPAVLRAGWESLAQANRLMAEIPLAAADEAVMTRQLAVQRYATALPGPPPPAAPQRGAGRRRPRRRRSVR